MRVAKRPYLAPSHRGGGPSTWPPRYRSDGRQRPPTRVRRPPSPRAHATRSSLSVGATRVATEDGHTQPCRGVPFFSTKHVQPPNGRARSARRCKWHSGRNLRSRSTTKSRPQQRALQRGVVLRLLDSGSRCWFRCLRAWRAFRRKTGERGSAPLVRHPMRAMKCQGVVTGSYLGGRTQVSQLRGDVGGELGVPIAELRQLGTKRLNLPFSA